MANEGENAAPLTKPVSVQFLLAVLLTCYSLCVSSSLLSEVKMYNL
jgi:hypothetical protein